MLILRVRTSAEQTFSIFINSVIGTLRIIRTPVGLLIENPAAIEKEQN
jgi:hypothetical protein